MDPIEQALNQITDRFETNGMVDSPLFGMTSEQILIKIIGGYMPDRNEMVYLAICSVLSSAHLRLVLAHLAVRLGEDQINMFINTTPPNRMSDIIESLGQAGRLNVPQWVRILFKAPFTTPIPTELLPFQALTVYYAKCFPSGRVPIVHHPEAEFLFLITAGPNVSVSWLQPNLDFLLMALFRTKHHAVLLHNNEHHVRQQNNETAPPDRNVFTIALLRANTTDEIQGISNLMQQFGIEMNALQREIFDARLNLTSYIIDVVSTTETDRRVVLLECCPTCVVARVDKFNPAPTDEEKLIALIRSVTPNRFTSGFNSNPAMMRTFIYQTSFFPIHSFTEEEYARMNDAMKKISFFKCMRLYSLYEIPASIRDLILARLEPEQIEGYYRSAKPLTSSQLHIWLDKLPSPAAIEKFITHPTCDAEVIGYAISKCQTRDDLVALLRVLTNKEKVTSDVVLRVLMKCNGDLTGIENMLPMSQFDGRAMSLLFALKKKTLGPAEYATWRKLFAPRNF